LIALRQAFSLPPRNWIRFFLFAALCSAMLQSSMGSVRRLVDSFTAALLVTVLLATVAPCRGRIAEAFEVITSAAIALLFFLHGAKLSREAIIAGAAHWRLHVLVFFSTFVLFPILGLLLRPLGAALLTPELYLGILFLCVLPSTVQSSIAFTSMAGGNVPAAICSASASNLFSVFLTPVLAGLFLGGAGSGVSMAGSIWEIVLQILIPFVSGHLLRPLIGSWVERRRGLTGLVDRGSILLVVYAAFSGAVVAGLWKETPVKVLLWLLVIDCLLLMIVMLTVWLLSALFGFNRADRITILFCGSKKSLATGVPIANVLFTGSIVGPMILPLMLFHQIQLMVCAALAQRWATLRTFALESRSSSHASRTF
jgi:solute carrier family 10 (sodium/bile acid cotransporter), member 7